MRYSGKVLRDEEISPGARTVKNPHTRTNVNVAQGPRTGNTGAHAGKRAAFKEAKVAREPLADMITEAFAARGRDDKEVIKPGVEGISANTRAKFKNKK